MVLVFIENVEGKFKKSAFEAVSYASALASKIGGSVTALSIGNVTEEELRKPGHYGVKKNTFSGKAFMYVELLNDIKVLSIMPNCYKVVESPVDTTVTAFNAQLADTDFKLTVKETIRSTDKVSLPDAELVVSAGRGM